jgi:tellurite resistance protein TerC
VRTLDADESLSRRPHPVESGVQMLEVTATAWGATIALIAFLLALDFLVGRGRRHAVALSEAVWWSVFYAAVAVVFGVGLGVLTGWESGAQFFAGYLVEKSLSIDNLFVFLIVMRTFAVPSEYEHRVLTFGILASIALRGLFIALGAALLEAFSIMFLVFGVLLVVTAVQLFRHRDEDPSVGDNVIVALARRALPISEHYDDGRLVTRIGGRRVVTPLFLVFLAISSTDVMFAFDSIPAVFGVTDEPYIVFVANAFALLGLRALFFVVNGLLDRLVYLSTGLSMILGFIGVKLILQFLRLQDDAVPEITTGTSLLVIVVVLALTTAASVVKVRRDPAARARAGSLRGTTLEAEAHDEAPLERA